MTVNENGFKTANEIRKAFLEFFTKQGHHIVPSAPMVVKNDPTLMFTNAGMNQFKDIFLGNTGSAHARVANTQKCLRVSGKHNDLEEVGHDTYHHTMFEMLGNWSFGDYFKKEAVDWAWEFLTDRMGIDPERIYATVYEGDPADGVDMDAEATEYWRTHLPSGRVLKGSRKDNFWEMGETGPCGPCSEIHVDIRPGDQRAEVDGRELVNQDHPEVLEIWNLVFIQYNRKSDGTLEPLPQKHVDTGLGFERLCMILQGVRSNYDTDVFTPLINEIGQMAGMSYGDEEESDVAMRVVADHLRAVSFSVADGQIPSNTGAGYVIRRILRRAVRYGYTFLEQSEAFIFRLVPVLCDHMGEVFPELVSQKETIMRVIREEEQSFLKTLDTGIRMLDQLITKAEKQGLKEINGSSAFVLYDTYGFPFDLTRLILREKGLGVNRSEFDKEMSRQKERSRNAAAVEAGDWIVVHEEAETVYTGYDRLLEEQVRIIRYRIVKRKARELYQLVLDRTPFYAESGGQVGDRGRLANENEEVKIIDTQKENELILHLANSLPEDPAAEFRAEVLEGARLDTAANHSATHLMHHALREVLGEHVEQKGSLVHPDYLRFDFSHFRKVSDEELRAIEKQVNRLIRHNIPADEHRSMALQEAMDMGALAFFGEKYGSEVRVIRFGDSVELCGGTHVRATGDIGLFKITRESAVAAGIRRIEAKTGRGAEEHIYLLEDVLKKLESLFKSHDVIGTVEKMLTENDKLRKEYEDFSRELREIARKNLLSRIEKKDNISIIAHEVKLKSAEQIKNLAFELKNQVPGLFLVLGAEVNGKAHLTVMISESLVQEHGLDARKIIKEAAPLIKGGGGGQDFYATAGGKNPSGIPEAIKKAVSLLS